MCRRPELLVPDERREEFRQLCEMSRIQVITWHHTGAPFCDLERRQIHVGWPFCERLWAHVCAYLAVYEWYERRNSPKTVGPFLEDLANASVMKLLNWALLADNVSARIPWPAETPRPPSTLARVPISFAAVNELLSPSMLNHFEGRVNRIFQRAIGWMLLHEMAHLWAGHSMEPPAGWTRQIAGRIQEMQADDFATQWFLGSSDEKYAADPLTILGVIGGHVMLISQALLPFNRNTPPASGHPDPPSRLRRLLRSFRSERDLAWIAASVFLELELRAQKLPSADNEEFGTDRHLCRAYECMGGFVISARADKTASGTKMGSQSPA